MSSDVEEEPLVGGVGARESTGPIRTLDDEE